MKDAIAAFGSTPVYAAPGATRLDAAQRQRIASEISAKGVDVHIAELPPSAGPPDAVIRRLAKGAGGGTVVAIVGGQPRAGSFSLPAGRAGQLLRESSAAHKENGEAILLDFVDRVASEESSGGSGAAPGVGSVGR